MIKRTISLTTMLLLLASVIVPTSGTAFAESNPPSLQEQAQDEVRRAIEDARKKATYDALGRITAASIELPSLGKFKFEYKYDRQSRLQYILDENGGRTQYSYGKTGELRRITLPDGTRLYELDEDGKSVFFKHGISRANNVRFSQTAMVRDPDGCRIAVAAAAVAAAAAAVSCSTGDIGGCILNTAAAAVAVAAAVKACGSELAADEGSVN
jgi:YD repeat-containing protein